MSFMNAMKDTLDEEYNYSVTENGALGYRTSGKELLDINYSIPLMRKMSTKAVYDKFMKAYFEDPDLAMRWLFFARDVRGGLGERYIFRSIIEHMAKEYPEIVNKIMFLIPEYGRYDDMWGMLNNNYVSSEIYKFVRNQLFDDMNNCMEGKNISLLAKWMPSENASSETTKANAAKMREALKTTPRQYRQMLTKLRKHIDVVETKMSAKNWSEINYEAVPSKANLNYKAAFLRNDKTRREKYLDKLAKGEAKINSSVLYPHEIVSKYTLGGTWSCSVTPYDATLEEMWKSLPNTVEGCNNTIVVADGSGSMISKVSGNTTALDVANAIAIYFSEKLQGEFKDKYITFSSRPNLVDFTNCNSLHDKVCHALKHNEVSNTNIKKVFELILTTAVNNKMSQEDIPANVLIISDMEFDSAQDYGTRMNSRLFEKIAKEYEDAGYKLPRLVFWNVNSRTSTIPVKENDMGVALVSGFSVNIAKMVMSGKLDPYECLKETLMSKRYDAVAAALN